MIENSRKREASASMKTIYFITVASMLGAAIPYFWRSLKQGTHYVMKVNGIGITTTEFAYNIYKERALLSIIRERSGVYYQQMLQLLGKTEQVEANVVEQLIIQKLVLWDAQRMRLSLSPQFVARELCHPQTVMSVLGEFIPPYIFNEQKSLNYAQLAEYLNRQGLTMSQFESMIDDQLLISEVAQLLKGTSVVSKAGQAFGLVPRLSTRKFKLDIFPLAPFLTEITKQETSIEQLQAFFENANRTTRQYWSPELRSGIIWSFDGELYMKKHDDAVDKSSGDAETREQKFERMFRIETDQILLSKNRDSLQRFIEESLGKRREINKVSSEKSASEPLIAALFSLQEIGSSTVVIQGMKAYIVELNSISSPEERPFEKVAEKVRGDYINQQARKALKERVIKGDIAGAQKVLEIAPSQQSISEDISGFGVTIEGLQGLVAEGQEASGMGSQGAYRIKLESVSAFSPELIQKEGGLQKIMGALKHQADELYLRQLVASLRNHAILSDVRLGRNEQ